MKELGIHALEIDPEFQSLIRPLTDREYVQLENNILEDGCLDPIITWKGMIIDGHNRYRICQTHHIPFRVIEKSFECREDVIVWICAHQLGRRNITEETRKFLIGMQYENEKKANAKKNAIGMNQYSGSYRNHGTPKHTSDRIPSGHTTAQRIGEENHVSWNTVYKYGQYAQIINQISEKVPELTADILSGRYRFSYKTLFELAKLDPAQIRKVIQKLNESEKNQGHFKSGRAAVQNTRGRAVEKPAGPSIKDMPAYDPDAELTSLMLTIPSWVSSIQRAKEKSNIALVSNSTKEKLVEAALQLQDMLAVLLGSIREEE